MRYTRAKKPFNGIYKVKGNKKTKDLSQQFKGERRIDISSSLLSDFNARDF